MAESIKAFSDPHYTYYRLTKKFGLLKAGTIFYHDPEDTIYGCAACGCLKNCWTADGNCDNGITGGSVILHHAFAETDLFEKVEWTPDEFLKTLDKGKYTLVIDDDGKWSVTKHGGFY